MSASDTCIRTAPCPKCGSKDNVRVYADGHEHCYSAGCTYHVFANGEGKTIETSEKPAAELLQGSVPAEGRPKRCLSAETMQRIGITQGYDKNGKPVVIYNYRNKSGALVAQKLRYAVKGDFPWVGRPKEAAPFGMHLQSGGGKRLFVTEGEEDAAALYQVLGHKWPVISVINGSQAAKKDLVKVLDYLESFEEVVLCLDNDEPGRKGAQEAAEALCGGRCKVKIASLPLKDASDMLVAGRVEELVQAVMFKAREFRPDGVINGSEVWEIVSKPVVMGVPYPWEGLNGYLYGLRPREIVTLCSGSGVGKSSVCAEIAYHLAQTVGKTVGYVALEEGIGRSGLRFLGLHANRPLHLPGHDLSSEERRALFDATLGTGRYVLYDHFGSLDSDNLLSKLRFMVKSCGVEFLILDHLSIVVSGMDLDGDERRMLDYTMTQLRSFTEGTGAGLILVSHLKRPQGQGHEEGAMTSLSQLRGSHAIAQLSDAVIGLERNQQADSPEEQGTLVLRVLKNRYAGTTGIAATLGYDHTTGRLSTKDGGLPAFEPTDGSLCDISF